MNTQLTEKEREREIKFLELILMNFEERKIGLSNQTLRESGLAYIEEQIKKELNMMKNQ